MARSCTVCNHKELEEINSLLLDNPEYRKIAQRFRLGEWALRRHKESHIPEALLKSKNIQEVVNANSLTHQIEEIRDKIKSLLQQAIEADNLRDAHNFVGDTLKQIELEAKIEGQIREQSINVYQQNVLINNPEWIELRTLIVKALEPYPEAGEALINALP